MVSEGIDPRIVNSVMGRADGSEMESRCHHLLPQKQERTISSMFQARQQEEQALRSPQGD